MKTTAMLFLMLMGMLLLSACVSYGTELDTAETDINDVVFASLQEEDAGTAEPRSTATAHPSDGDIPGMVIPREAGVVYPADLGAKGRDKDTAIPAPLSEGQMDGEDHNNDTPVDPVEGSVGEMGKKSIAGTFIIDFVYEEGMTFKSAISQISEFDFTAISEISVIHIPVGDKPRSEELYNDEATLDKANSLLDFIPRDCRVENKAATGWTEMIIFRDTNGVEFTMSKSEKGLLALRYLHVDCEEDIYGMLRGLFS